MMMEYSVHERDAEEVLLEKDKKTAEYEGPARNQYLSHKPFRVDKPALEGTHVMLI